MGVVPTYPNYDTYYHLVWGRELLDGVKPSFTAYAAPTEHPLFLLLCAVVGLVGRTPTACSCSSARSRSSRSCGGRTAWARRCSAAGRALLGALFVGSSFAFLLYAARAYVDVPFLAIVLWAAAVEARSPRRGRAVMGLLAVAGLLRPEAWVLAGAYWLWCIWPARAARASASTSSRSPCWRR